MSNATTSRITFRIASSRTDYLNAFSLIYQDRINKGFVTLNAHGQYFEWQHLMPESVVILAEKDGELIGTVSMVRKSPDCPLPLETDFDLGNRWDFSRRIVEVCSLAIASEYQKQAAKVLYPLYGMILHYTQYHAPVDILLFAIHPKDARFYEQQLFAKPVFDRGKASKPKAYSNANGAPAVLRYIEFPNWTHEMKENGGRDTCNDLLANSLFRFDSERILGEKRDPLSYRISHEDVSALLKRLRHIKVVSDDVSSILCDAYKMSANLAQVDGSESSLNPRSDRVDLKGLAEIRFENSKIEARLINASESGFRAELSREIPLSLFNLLKVKIVAASGIVLVARPVWRNGKQVGFNIVNENNLWNKAVKRAMHEEAFNFGNTVCLSRIMRDVDITRIRMTNQDNYEPTVTSINNYIACEVSAAVWVDGLIHEVSIKQMSSRNIIVTTQRGVTFEHENRYNLFIRYSSGLMLEVVFKSWNKDGSATLELKGNSEQFEQTLAEFERKSNSGNMSKDSFRAA